MTRRQKVISEEKAGSDEDVQDPPPQARRTRSGRTVRTPAALLDSEAPARTPARRTRRSVLQDLPVVEEKNTDEPEEKPEEEMPGTSAEPEPQPDATAADTDGAGVDRHLSRSEPETAPTSSEAVPQKKPRLAPNGKQNPAIPLGKPKSGRVWKDRNKQR